jgi:alanine racemase
MPRPISATISCSSLRHNLEVVSQQLEHPEPDVSGRPRPRIWAVIKANAYGHGIKTAVSAFSRADGLAMLDLDEAVRCREAGWAGPILLLEGFFEPRDIAVVDTHRFSIVLHCQEQVDMLLSARVKKPVNVWVKLNTGMNRLGFSAEEYSAVYQRILVAQDAGIIGTLGKMTHFACADDDPAVTLEQLALFDRVTRHLPGTVSVCNSAATLTPGMCASVADTLEQWVRPGICLYGASPFAHKSAASFGLQPAMTLRSRLISVRSIERGAGIGYGYSFFADQPMRVGVVACGYADGYPRHAPTGTPMTVNNIATRLVGRVSMDMLMVDVTHIPTASVGSPVVLWGEGGPSVDEVAAASGTIGYELLCALAARVPKVLI